MVEGFRQPVLEGLQAATGVLRRPRSSRLEQPLSRGQLGTLGGPGDGRDPGWPGGLLARGGPAVVQPPGAWLVRAGLAPLTHAHLATKALKPGEAEAETGPRGRRRRGRQPQPVIRLLGPPRRPGAQRAPAAAAPHRPPEPRLLQRPHALDPPWAEGGTAGVF